jgi:hypothetical protein
MPLYVVAVAAVAGEMIAEGGEALMEMRLARRFRANKCGPVHQSEGQTASRWPDVEAYELTACERQKLLIPSQTLLHAHPPFSFQHNNSNHV